MKKTYRLFAVAFLLLTFVYSNSNATVGVLPQFDLSIRNLITFPVGSQDSLANFDIYCEWTNSEVSDPFNFAASQTTLFWNNIVVTPPGGPANTFLTKISSELPPGNQSTTFSTSPSSGVPLLRASANIPVNNSFLISTVFPGTKILGLRLRTSVHSWNLEQYFQLRFKVGASPNTLFSYFDPDGVVVAFTDTNLYQRIPLFEFSPVELSSFTSSASGNKVSLTWFTAREDNNAGFDIERKLASSTEWTKVGYVLGNGSTTETKNFTFTERINTGKYNYRLKQMDFNGNHEYFYLSNEIEVGIPTEYAISQNYPNPFNPSTKIDFELPYDGKVSVLLYDISGREVAKIVNEVKSAGYYTVNFNASNLSSGMYFYRITADKFVETKKMALIK